MYRPTCARTRAGRLARLDEDLALEEAALLERRDGCVVDVGYGATPVTTRELAARLPGARIVGVEADPRNVPPPADGGPTFVVGGFDLPRAARPALVIRATNVLRGYPPAEATAARATMGGALVDGGVLVEGTTGPRGEVAVVGWWRRRGDALRREATLFSTTFENGFAPLVFRDRMPRDERGLPDDVLRAFFADWVAAYDEARSSTRDAPERFVGAAAALARRRSDVRVCPDRWAAGRLWWRGPEREVNIVPHVAPAGLYERR